MIYYYDVEYNTNEMVFEKLRQRQGRMDVEDLNCGERKMCIEKSIRVTISEGSISNNEMSAVNFGSALCFTDTLEFGNWKEKAIRHKVRRLQSNYEVSPIRRRGISGYQPSMPSTFRHHPPFYPANAFPHLLFQSAACQTSKPSHLLLRLSATFSDL